MRRHKIALGAALLAVCGGAAAIAGAAGGDDTINACRNLRHGLVRIVIDTGSCKRNEGAVSWSRQGPVGPAGAGGAEG